MFGLGEGWRLRELENRGRRTGLRIGDKPDRARSFSGGRAVVGGVCTSSCGVELIFIRELFKEFVLLKHLFHLSVTFKSFNVNYLIFTSILKLFDLVPELININPGLRTYLALGNFLHCSPVGSPSRERKPLLVIAQVAHLSTLSCESKMKIPRRSSGIYRTGRYYRLTRTLSVSLPSTTHPSTRRISFPN